MKLILDFVIKLKEIERDFALDWQIKNVWVCKGIK